MQAQKKIVRLVNANFWNDDVLLTLTYKPADSPLDDKQAKKDITNYLRRVKYFREKKAKDLKKQIKAQPKNKKLKADLKKASEPMKYIYAFECKTYKKGKRKGQKSYHFHLFLTGCGSGDRDEYEKLWNGRTNADRFQPDSFGPDTAAKYIAKGDGATQGQKKYVCSKNLAKPVQKVKDDVVMDVGEIPGVVCQRGTAKGVINALAAAAVYIAENLEDKDIDKKAFNRLLENAISYQKEIRDQVKRIIKQWKEINHDE